MQDWTGGYVTDIGYTHGFYREMGPTLLSFATLANGMRSPDPAENLSFCELGCGQGLSVNIFAAANPHIDFYATDFNPGQITSAQRLAAEAELTNVKFFDHAFKDFSDEALLPDSFDIIALHGIYSWISPENRGHIVEFIRKKLKPGGLVYISYNVLPGWAPVMPLRHLLVSSAERAGGPILPRIEQAMQFVEELKAAGADYFKVNPTVDDKFGKMQPMSRSYLAHEYFNRDWTPFYFQQVADDLSGAKVRFAASAHLPDQIDAINLTGDQIKFLSKETDPERRQGLRDFLVNQQFRRDIFVKGGEAYTLSESRSAWLEMRLALSVRVDDVALSIKTRLGDVSLHPDVYEPILSGLSKGPIVFKDLLKFEKVGEQGWSRLQQAVAVLVGLGHVHVCLPIKNEKKRRDATRSLNAVIINRSVDSADLAYLASPVTGSGVSVGRFEQLFLRSYLKGNTDPKTWATQTWEILKVQGQKLIKDGKAIDTDEGNIEELSRQASEFDEKKLGALKVLQIV